MTEPSVYSLDPARTTTALARLHRGERYQPMSLRSAVRTVLRTRTDKLMVASAYLNGVAKAPLRDWVSDTTGRRYLDDGHDGRVFEIAAAIEHIESHDLDARVVSTLRGSGYLTDEEAFAVLASGASVRLAHRYWMDANELPPLQTLYTLAVLRGINVTADEAAYI